MTVIKTSILIFSTFMAVSASHASDGESHNRPIFESCASLLGRTTDIIADALSSANRHVTMVGSLIVNAPAYDGDHRSYFNGVALKNHRPPEVNDQPALGIMAHGQMPPDFRRDFKNFLSDNYLTPAPEIETLKVGEIETLLNKYLFGWEHEPIWFFETTEEISLYPLGSAALPKTFAPQTFVIMRNQFAIGQVTFEGEVKLELF